MLSLRRWFQRFMLFILVLLFGFFSGSTTPTLLAVQQPAAGATRLIADTVVGQPVAAGDYLFWIDQRAGHTAIYGYHLTDHHPFRVKSLASPAAVKGLASDGRHLVWVERPVWADQQVRVPARIQGYDIAARREFTLVAATDLSGFATTNPAVADGVVYYEDQSVDHAGLYARTWETGQEERISRMGQDPVVADGVLLWHEAEPRGQRLPPVSRLYMQQRGRTEPTLVAQGPGWFSGYGVAADRIVWSLLPAPGESDERVYAYRIATGNSAPVSAGPGRFPVISAGGMAWVQPQRAARQSPSRYAIMGQRVGPDADPGAPLTLVAPGTALVQPRALLDAHGLVVTVAADPSAVTQQLYLSPLDQPGLPFNAVTSAAHTHLAAASEQVYASGRRLYVAGEYWGIFGVQFFLPFAGYGINAKTFRDTEFEWTSGPAAEFSPTPFIADPLNREPANLRGARAYFLEKAATELNAQTLRIWIALPGERDNEGANNRFLHKDLYAFAREVDARGMRLGVVLHNSADFTMTEDKAAWIADFIACFQGKGVAECGDDDLTHVLAYASADNEINLHCENGSTRNCYAERTYATAANEWVHQVKRIFDENNDLNRPILVTVGMGTEIGAVSLEEIIANFTDAPAPRQLDDIVDFIAPHNYGGGGYGIFQEVNKQGILQPVVLEEYGYATDPQQTGNYREGDPICRIMPYDEACDPEGETPGTAPYYVEVNIDALQEENFAGGVVFMLVDVLGDKQNKNCSNIEPETGMLPDYFTGLYAVGGTYCDGARNRGFAESKATAYRVCLHHTGDDIQQCRFLGGEQVFLPLLIR
jgi:hypothetical protein